MKFFYLKICILYNILSSFVQDRFLKKKIIEHKNENQLIQRGYKLYEFNNEISNHYKVQENIKVSKYISKDIILENSIMKIIDLVFVKNKFAKIVSDITGFYYSIDFVVGYETFHIPQKDQSKDWYANKWHNDKPFSKNTLKFIIPLNNNFQGQSGGIEIMDIIQTKNYIDKKIIPNQDNIFLMKNLNHELLIFNPNLCYHKAGNPDEGKSRKQIMFQLNPSKKWCINSKIFKKQFKIEPKFPSFNYIWDKRISLKI